VASEPELRFDALSREWVAITGGRQRRPNLPTDECPFCVRGLEATDPYATKAFSNRWPPLLPGGPAALTPSAGRAPAHGAAEIVLYSPEHEASLATIGREAVRRVVDLWAERTEALAARPEVEYVLVFENRGAEVGATIPHPHGQIYGLPFVPPVAAREAEVADAFGCPVCAEVASEIHDQERLVRSSDGWVAFTRFASRWPYEMLVAPLDHHASLADLDERHRSGLAVILPDVLGRYDRLFARPLPYMLWLHGGVHLHVHVVTPLRDAGTMRFVAAGELGSGLMFNPVPPEEAAERLRSAGGALDG
jgi:UDPglucose--hexose-1-phosphate uridylyltransferase